MQPADQPPRLQVVPPPVRRDLATSDPEVIMLYERLVIAREGTRWFRERVVDQVHPAFRQLVADYRAAADDIELLLNAAQERLEGLR